MAYGKNKARKGWLMRAVPLGLGEVSKAKASRLFTLRALVLRLMGEMAEAGFSVEPLSQTVDAKEMDAKLLAVQKSFEGLNSVWPEQARMRVKPALEETNKRYFARLRGSLRFVDQQVPKDEMVLAVTSTYQSRTTDKLLYNGVAEIVVPSWYTSRACFRHSKILDKKHRKGERIYLSCFGRYDHADEHAADTIATYGLLRQKLTLGQQSSKVCDTSYPLPARAKGKHWLLGR